MTGQPEDVKKIPFTPIRRAIARTTSAHCARTVMLPTTPTNNCQQWFDMLACRYNVMGITIDKVLTGFLAQHHRPAATPVMLGRWSNRTGSGWVYDRLPDVKLADEIRQ